MATLTETGDCESALLSTGWQLKLTSTRGKACAVGLGPGSLEFWRVSGRGPGIVGSGGTAEGILRCKSSGAASSLGIASASSGGTIEGILRCRSSGTTSSLRIASASSGGAMVGSGGTIDGTIDGTAGWLCFGRKGEVGRGSPESLRALEGGV